MYNPPPLYASFQLGLKEIFKGKFQSPGQVWVLKAKKGAGVGGCCSFSIQEISFAEMIVIYGI